MQSRPASHTRGMTRACPAHGHADPPEVAGGGRARQRRSLTLALGAWLVASSLAGCSTPVRAPAGAMPAAGHGTVLVRPSMVGLINVSGFGLLARPVGREGTIEFNGWSLSSDGYWTQTRAADVKGQLVAAQLPAGSYEFFSFVALNSAGLATGTTRPTQAFSYPFQVRAGEVSYLGEFRMRFEQSRLPTAGSSSNVPYRVELRDNRAQDFAAASKLVADLRPEQITVRLLGTAAAAR